MSRKTTIICDGCGATGGLSAIDRLGSGWSTVTIIQKWPGVIDKPGEPFDLCSHCSERVLPTSWPRLSKDYVS